MAGILVCHMHIIHLIKGSKIKYIIQFDNICLTKHVIFWVTKPTKSNIGFYIIKPPFIVSMLFAEIFFFISWFPKLSIDSNIKTQNAWNHFRWTFLLLRHWILSAFSDYIFVFVFLLGLMSHYKKKSMMILLMFYLSFGFVCLENAPYFISGTSECKQMYFLHDHHCILVKVTIPCSLNPPPPSPFFFLCWIVIWKLMPLFAGFCDMPWEIFSNNSFIC